MPRVSDEQKQFYKSKIRSIPARGQKVRGLRHLQYRPRLVVVEDPEDGEWVRTKETRDKTDRWLHSEIIPGMFVKKGKLVVIGNLLHMDTLLTRLRSAAIFTHFGLVRPSEPVGELSVLFQQAQEFFKSLFRSGSCHDGR